MNMLRQLTLAQILLYTLIGVIAAGFSLLPHVIAYNATPQGMVFLGQAAWFDPWDINVYVSVIRWGQTNGLLVENVYTTASNAPTLYYPMYSLIGRLFRQADPFLLFYASSFVTTMLLSLTIGFFSQRIINSISEAIFVLGISLLGGGLGFISIFSDHSLDATMTSFTLASAVQRPHEAIGIIGYIVLMMMTLFWISNPDKRIIPLLLLFSILAFISYPFLILPYFLVTGIFALISKKMSLLKPKYVLTHIILYVFMTLIVVGMYVHLSQNTTFPSMSSLVLSGPSGIGLIIGYGLFLPFLWHRIIDFKQWSKVELFLFLWVTISIFLSLLPFGFSRFFLRSLFFPLSLITAISLQQFSLQFFTSDIERQKKYLMTFIFTIFLFTQLSIFFTRLSVAGSDNPWLYIPAADYRAIAFIRNELPIGARVLSLFRAGNILPAHTNSRVFYGHMLQTPASGEKSEQVERVFSGELSADALYAFLIENAIEYVYFGIQEQEFAGEFHFNPSSYPFLHEVYESEGVLIYQFVNE